MSKPVIVGDVHMMRMLICHHPDLDFLILVLIVTFVYGVFHPGIVLLFLVVCHCALVVDIFGNGLFRGTVGRRKSW